MRKRIRINRFNHVVAMPDALYASLIICVFTLLVFSSDAISSPVTDQKAPSITVLPFAHDASSIKSKDLEWLPMSIAESITFELYNIPQLKTAYLYEWRQKLNDMQDEPDETAAHRAGSAAGFEYVVFGTFLLSDNDQLKTVIEVMRITDGAIVLRVEHELKTPEMLTFARAAASEIAVFLGIAPRESLPPPASIDKESIKDVAIGYKKMLMNTLSASANENYLKHFKRAAQRSPDYYDAWINTGWAYYTDKDYEKASETFKNIYERNDQLVDALAGLGLSQIRLNNFKQGMDYLASARSLYPNSSWIRKAYYDEAFNSPPEIATQPVMELIVSEDQQEKKKALDFLNKLNKAEHAEYFFAFMNSPDPTIKDYCIKKMLTLCDSRCNSQMKEHLNEIRPYIFADESAIRYSTIIVLGEVGALEGDLDVKKELWSSYYNDSVSKNKIRALISLCYLMDSKALDRMKQELDIMKNNKLKSYIFRLLAKRKAQFKDTELIYYIDDYKLR